MAPSPHQSLRVARAGTRLEGSRGKGWRWTLVLGTVLLLSAILAFIASRPRAVTVPVRARSTNVVSGVSSSGAGSMAAIDTTSYLKPEWKESYSLWVVPGGTQAAKLQLEIDTLREAHPGAPPFRAHVTVLSGISGPGEAAVAKAAKVAAAVQPYYVSFVNVTRGAIYFQCIYLLCAKDAKTMAAGAQARAVFGLSPAQPYMPHCSLLYSDMPQGERDAVVATSHQRLYGEGSTYNTLLTETGFTVDTIELWYTPGEDTSCASWAKVAEFPLAGSA